MRVFYSDAQQDEIASGFLPDTDAAFNGELKGSADGVQKILGYMPVSRTAWLPTSRPEAPMSLLPFHEALPRGVTLAGPQHVTFTFDSKYPERYLGFRCNTDEGPQLTVVFRQSDYGEARLCASRPTVGPHGEATALTQD